VVAPQRRQVVLHGATGMITGESYANVYSILMSRASAEG
jgi:hypothetical protein